MDKDNNSDIAALSRSLKRYRLVLDTMNHGVQENDCEGTITYSNRAHHMILGYGDSELLGRKIWDVQPSSAEQEQLKSYLASLVKEQPLPEPYLTRCLRKDGVPVDLKIDWDYERDDAGVLTGFISVITDITEHRKIEKDLHHRTQGLTALLDVSKSLTATLDLQKVLQIAVDEVTSLVGLDTAAVYLLEDENLYLWATTPPLPEQFPDELRNAALADHPHIRQAITTAEPVFVSDMLTVDLSTAERAVMEQRNLRTLLFVPLITETRAIGVFIVGSVGNPCLVSDAEINLSRTLANLAALTVRNAQLYKDSQKHAAQLEQTLVDRIKAEQERKDLQAQLLQSQKIESIGRLAGGIAHDFNNMLGVILGYADLALSKLDEKHAHHNDLVQIRNAAKRSANLTHQLLAFARKQNVMPRILNLNDVISDMLQMLRRLIGEDIDLVWLPGVNTGFVKIDPAQVDQILANLCVNARDAISGVGKLTIETDNICFDETYCAEHPGFIPGDYVMLAVSDNGVGIEQEVLTNIFEPYFSTKIIGKGTGLGLSTVYGIVRQNEGFINVYSEPEQGTTFKIYFRRNEADGAEKQIKTTDQVEQGGSETILFVEDENMILDIGMRILESLGYKVLAMNNPAEALLFARQYAENIDLLITDVVMPEMNGRELAEQIEAFYPGMKTLYISGYTANVIAHRGILHDGVKFLSKPFTRNELAGKVRETISMKNEHNKQG